MKILEKMSMLSLMLFIITLFNTIWLVAEMFNPNDINIDAAGYAMLWGAHVFLLWLSVKQDMTR